MDRAHSFSAVKSFVYGTKVPPFPSLSWVVILSCLYAISLPNSLFVGLARTIYIWCTYGIFGLEITKYTVYIYVYIRFWPTLIISLACAGFGRQAARYGERIFGSIRDQKYGQLFKLFVGLARNVYIHRIWPNVLWFPCQKYRIYTVYTVLANSSYLRTFSRPEPCD